MPGRSTTPVARMAILAALLLAPLSAQQEEPVTYNFGPEGLTLDEAIEFASKATGRSFMYAENQFRNKKVMISGIVKIPQNQVYEFWQAVFATQGFAMVAMGPEEGDVVYVDPIDQSRQLKQRATYVSVEELVKWQRKVGEVVMTTIPLVNVRVDQVRQAVTQILANRNVEFSHEVQSANSLIVVGFAPTVYAVYQMMKAMDQPSVGLALRFEIISLKYAVADELITILQDLIQSGDASARSAVARPVAVPTPEGVITTGGWQEKPEPKIISDSRTNSVVVYAVDSDLAEIKRLIGALDTEVTELDSNIRVYYLKNTNADDMEETLREVLEQGATRSTRPGTTAGTRPGAQPTTTSERGQEVSIVADTNTNSLIITCTRTRYGEIEELIRELDRRRPQVLVQAAIAELSDNDLVTIGAEITAIEGGDDRYRFAGATGFGLSTITTTTTGGGGDGGGTGGSGTGTGGGTGGSTGTTGAAGLFDDLVRVPFLNQGGTGISFTGLVLGIFENNLNVPLLVSLLQSKTKGNLVSVPSVLTNDNEESTITVSRQVPTVSFQTTAAGTDQTSFQGYQEAKLELRISPHISNDDYLRLEIELLVEAFVGAQLSAGVPPPKTTRQFVGSVTVPNGKTVVIGGLVEDNYSVTSDQVPFLGDIPILGYLFKTESTSKIKTTLYLFVTPTIFKDFQGLEEVSYDKKLEIQKLEGNVKLIDPHFRETGLDNPDLDIEKIEDSGTLEVPRYAPLTPLGSALEAAPVGGPTVRPRPSQRETEAVIPPAGTRELKTTTPPAPGAGRTERENR